MSIGCISKVENVFKIRFDKVDRLMKYKYLSNPIMQRKCLFMGDTLNSPCRLPPLKNNADLVLPLNALQQKIMSNYMMTLFQRSL